MIQSDFNFQRFFLFHIFQILMVKISIKKGCWKFPFTLWIFVLPWRKMTKDTEERVWMCICTERNMGQGPNIDMLLNKYYSVNQMHFNFQIIQTIMSGLRSQDAQTVTFFVGLVTSVADSLYQFCVFLVFLLYFQSCITFH